MHLLTVTLTLVAAAFAIELDISSTASISNASRTIVGDILAMYGKAEVPGLFPTQYYWWEDGLGEG